MNANADMLSRYALDFQFQMSEHTVSVTKGGVSSVAALQLNHKDESGHE